VKLLIKTNLYYILVALIIFCAGTAVFYWNLKHIMYEDATEKLHAEAGQIAQSLDQLGKMPEQFITAGDKITIQPATASALPVLRDTLIYDKADSEELHYRVYSFTHPVNSKLYLITISHPIFESDDLIPPIVKSMLGILAALLGGMLLITQWISRKLWKPFYAALDQLKNYNLAQRPAELMRHSGIHEFDELNAAITKMTDKIHADYNSLKAFSENASHEIQTPLAIIQSKLEMLIQSKDLREEQMKLIREVYESANRLSKLNQALILLTRIGNKQFADTLLISMNELVEKKLEHFEELLLMKEIRVSRELTESPALHMNPVLADVLIANLIGNAIKHNVKNGQLHVKTTKQSLTISNTGELLHTPPAELFDRFRKENASSESLGLGLSIVRQICDTYQIKISYTCVDKLHTIVLHSLA
jgi:signal transduction histidine kinase